MSRQTIRFSPFLILLVLVFSASVWDFRPMGQRLFDVVPILICAIYLTLNWKTIPRPSKIELMIAAYVLVYCVYGYVMYQHRSSIVIAVMFLMFLLLRPQLSQDVLDRVLKYILFLHVGVFYLQLAVYHATGTLIDFQVLFGSASRVESHDLIRPVGLNSEPHNLGVMMIMLTLMTLHQKHLRMVHYLACFAMPLSLSMWGMLGGPALAVLLVCKDHDRFWEIVKKSTLILSTMAFAFVVFYGLIVQSQDTYESLTRRFTELPQDASLHERLLPSKPNATPLEQKAFRDSRSLKDSLKSQRPLVQIALGSGLSTYPFTTGSALNAYAFVFHSFGILGLAAAALGLFWFWTRYLNGRMSFKLSFFGIIAFLGTSYPMVTYAFFWIFLATLINSGSQNCSRNQ